MEQEVDSRIPDQIATWIESTLGPWALVADVSWPRSNSCVWQVRLGEADAFVKISPSAGAFHRERSALVDVLPGAMAATTPSLLGSADNLLTLTTSRVDGEVVRRLNPTPAPTSNARFMHEPGWLSGQCIVRSSTSQTWTSIALDQLAGRTSWNSPTGACRAVCG